MICGDIGASGTRIHASDVQCRTETRRKNIVDVKGLVLVYSPIYDTVFIGDVFEGGKGREGESCRVVFSVFGRKLSRYRASLYVRDKDSYHALSRRVSHKLNSLSIVIAVPMSTGVFQSLNV